MAQFLDYRSSENSNTLGFPSTALSIDPNSPSFIGDIGLIVGTTAKVRVDLWSTVALAVDESVGNPTTILFFIARNLNPTSAFSASNVIYAATEIFQEGDFGAHIITFNTADLNGVPGPIPEQINYSLFAAADQLVIRVGPETFTGMAVTG